MASLSSLSSATTAATALSNLILVTPQTNLGYQPQNAPKADGTPSTKQNPPSLLFDYEGEQTVTLESDITDHFVEDNTAVQDQISLKPITITTHGFIGELNDIAPLGLQTLKAIADKLTTVGSYTPALSTTALIAYNEALLLYQTAQNAVNSAVSAWSSLTGGAGNQTKQQIAYSAFYGYWSSRTLFTVQTPWAIFNNMAIKTLRAIQDAETRMISDFEVTFKMIRYSSTISIKGIPVIFQQRSAIQSSGLVNNGTSTPQSSISLTSGLFSMGVT